jgi:hypothetical protein
VLGRIEAKIAELEAMRGEVRATLAACDEGRCQFAG